MSTRNKDAYYKKYAKELGLNPLQEFFMTPAFKDRILREKGLPSFEEFQKSSAKEASDNVQGVNIDDDRPEEPKGISIEDEFITGMPQAVEQAGADLAKAKVVTPAPTPVKAKGIPPKTVNAQAKAAQQAQNWEQKRRELIANTDPRILSMMPSSTPQLGDTSFLGLNPNYPAPTENPVAQAQEDPYQQAALELQTRARQGERQQKVGNNWVNESDLVKYL